MEEGLQISTVTPTLLWEPISFGPNSSPVMRNRTIQTTQINHKWPEALLHYYIHLLYYYTWFLWHELHRLLVAEVYVFYMKNIGNISPNRRAWWVMEGIFVIMLIFTSLLILAGKREKFSCSKSHLESYSSLSDLTWHPMHEHWWQPGEEEEGDVGGEGYEQEEDAPRCTGEN